MKMARTAASRCGFAFDVDGVLVRGPQVLSRATAALQLLRDRGVPLCFVTNGGGTTEEWRAKTLTKRLELPVSADEVCLCHTPMQPRIDQILREDDGALLSVAFDAAADQSFLVVINATTMAEIARANMVGHLAANFHGKWCPEGADHCIGL